MTGQGRVDCHATLAMTGWGEYVAKRWVCVFGFNEVGARHYEELSSLVITRSECDVVIHKWLAILNKFDCFRLDCHDLTVSQ